MTMVLVKKKRNKNQTLVVIVDRTRSIKNVVALKRDRQDVYRVSVHKFKNNKYI